MSKLTREEKIKKFIEKLDKEEELNTKIKELKDFLKDSRKIKFKIKDLEIEKEMNELNNIDNTEIDQLIKLNQTKVNKIYEMMEYLKNNNSEQYEAIHNVLIKKIYQSEYAKNENVPQWTIQSRIKMGLKNIINNFDI